MVDFSRYGQVVKDNKLPGYTYGSSLAERAVGMGTRLTKPDFSKYGSVVRQEEAKPEQQTLKALSLNLESTPPQFKTNTAQSTPSIPENPEEDKSYASRVSENWASRLESLKNNTPEEGASGFLAGFSKALTDVSGMAVSPVVDGAMSVDAVKDIFEVVGIAANQAKQMIAEPVGSIPALQRMVMENPEATKTLENVLETIENAGILSNDVLILRGAFDVARRSGTAVAESPVGQKVGEYRQSMKDAATERVYARRTEELTEILNSYNKTRPLTQTAESKASVRRVAEGSNLEGAVNADGRISVMDRGGAYDQYKAATIKGREGTVRTLLENEGATVHISQVEAALRKALNDARLEGSQRKLADSALLKEIEGLKASADAFGNIKLTVLHDAKIATNNGIKYSQATKNTNAATRKKAIARTYKEIIEKTSKENIKEINAELANYYKDLDILATLEGKKVKGGRLGKYFSQISGNIVGGAVGGAIGGPIGVAAGTVLGGETASLLRGKQMASTFGKGTGKTPKPNPVLDAAKERSGAGKKANLKTPDKTVGAPKTVPKTKEIHKIEKDIKKNVKAQHAAIKAKDFTLVAKLKEAYTLLVEKLTSEIRKVRDLMNETGSSKGAIKNPFVREEIGKVKPSSPKKRNIYSEAKQVLKDFPNGNPAARELLRDYVFGKKTEASRTELATAIDMLKGKS